MPNREPGLLLPCGSNEAANPFPLPEWYQRKPENRNFKYDSQFHNIILKISRFELKIACHTKNKEDLKLQEKRESEETIIKMTEMLESYDKGAIIEKKKHFNDQLQTYMKQIKKHKF